MEDVRRFIFFAVLPLLFLGCASTFPSGRSAERQPHDPWATTVESSAPVVQAIEEPRKTVEAVAFGSIVEKPATDSPVDEKFLEQKNILSRDDWARNHELQRWIENGMKDPNPVRDPIEAKRQAELYRLNNATSKDDATPEFHREMTTGLLSTWRWVHRDLEKLQPVSNAQRLSTKQYLIDAEFQDKTFDVLRANAAIFLGRDGDESAKKSLFEAAENEKLRPEIRCAAVETLGKFSSTSAEDLIPLLKLAKERTTETFNDRTGLSERKFFPGNLALWTELLTAIAEKVEPWERPCFVEPLTARSADVRLETARIWRRNPPKQPGIVLPPEFLKFAAEERDSSVRVEILRTLGAWKQPNILPLVKNDLNYLVQVRNAALDAIAATNCQEAIPLIQDKLKDTAPRNRAKAVETLRKLGQLDDVFRQSDDKDWEVRTEVAKALADRRSPKSVELAKRYLADYPKVQTATFEAIATWPLEESGPLLLDELKGITTSGRTQAQKILAAQWEEAEEFNVFDLPKNQVANHAELVRRFQEFLKFHGKSVDLVDDSKSTVRTVECLDDENLLEDLRKTLDELAKPSILPQRQQDLEAKLISFGPKLIPILERFQFSERRQLPKSLDVAVLAKIDPVFAAIVKLDSSDLNLRRRGVGDLMQFAAGVSLGRLAIDRILKRCCGSDDHFVVVPLSRILEDSVPEFALQASRTMVGSESTEIRRRACEILKKNGEGQDLPLLADLLSDRSATVLRTALEAIAQIVATTESDEFPDEKKKIVDELRSLLPRLDPFLQADAAATLHYLGSPTGIEILQRLSLSKESKVQVYVAKTLGNLDDPIFVPILIRFLKVDGGGVRQAALESLPKLVGENIGDIETPETRSSDLSPSQKKSLRWEDWAKRRY